MVYVLGRQVFTRYVLGSSEYWTEELARYFLIWMAFLGGALAVRRNAHLSMGLAVMHLRGRTALAVRRARDLCVAVFAGIMLFPGGAYVRVAMEQRTPVTQIPMGLIYLPIPLAGALILLFLAERLVAGEATPGVAPSAD
jgi:TRAP-type C4-dicarboxylate transport system permease small subunit